MSGNLAHSPADILRHLLVNAGQGALRSVSQTWPIDCGNMPDKPDDSMCVYDTAPVQQGTDQTSGEQLENYGATVVVRHTTRSDGWTKAKTLDTYLQESVRNVGVTIGSSVYLVYAVTKTSGPIALREEGTKRFLFNINAVVSLRQTI